MVVCVLLAALAGAQGTPEKLKGGLNTATLSNDSVQRFLVVPRWVSDVPALENELAAENRSYSFKPIGNVLIVDLPSRKALDWIAKKSVREIWPDLEVTTVDEEALQQINAHAAWDLNYRGDSEKIAILDTGIDATHSAFQDRVIAAQNFSDSDTVSDRHGHGTHVAGIAAGFGDANGVAPRALLLNAKVLNDSGSGSFSTVINGINWAADQNADVINLSLGALSHDTDSPLNQAVRDAAQQGIVVVVAAGNCGNGCPAQSCGSFRGVTLPGNTQEALTVGAVDAKNKHACFSSGEVINKVGIKPDLAAPGVDILSALPNQQTGRKTGTSMATPFVAGAAALAKQAHPLFSSYEIKQLLENISNDLGETGKDTEFGSGLLDLSHVDSNDAEFWNDKNQNNDFNKGDNQDFNQLDEQFYFYGPVDLNKNESGLFEIDHKVGGGGFSEINGQGKTTKDTVVEFVFLDEAGNSIDYNVWGPIEISDVNNYRFSTFFFPPRTGVFKAQAFVYQDGELIQNLSEKDSNLQTATAEKTVFVRLPKDLLNAERIVLPSTLKKGEKISLEIPVSNTGNQDTNAFVEILFIDSENRTSLVIDSDIRFLAMGTKTIFSPQKKIQIPSGDYNILVSLVFENQKKIIANQTVRVSLENALKIESVQLPLTVHAQETVPVAVTIQNQSDATLYPSLFVLLSDQNKTVKSFFDSNRVLEPHSSQTMDWNWTVTETAQTYDAKVIARAENESATKTKTVTVLDEKPPVLSEIGFEPVVLQNSFVAIQARATDFSAIKSMQLKNQHGFFLMKKQNGTDSNALFKGALVSTEKTGKQFFSIRVCDEFSNCYEQEFTFEVQTRPSNCENRFFLVVRDNDGVELSPNGQNWLNNLEKIPFCFAEWTTRELGLPDLKLLQRFNAVIWSTGNHFGPSLDNNKTALLELFTQKSGRLFLEGSDVSSEHGFDSFAYNLLHGEFELEIGQDKNFGNNPNQPYGGQWWDNTYPYKRCLNITANQPGMDTNTVIDVSVNDLNIANLFIQGKTRADFADIRVVYNDTTQIDRAIHTRFLQDLNADNYMDFNRLSFKLQTAISNGSTSTGEYCMYYGNPAAILPPQDYNNVFVAGDSFNRPNNVSAGNQWNETYATNDIFTVDNNMLKLDTDAGGGNGCAQFMAPYLTSDSVLQWNTYQNGSGSNIPYLKTVQNTDTGQPIGLGYQPPEQNMVLEEWSTGVRALHNQAWANNTFAVFKNDFAGGSGGQMLTAAMSTWTPRISYAHAKSASYTAFTCGFGGGTVFWIDSLIVRNFRNYTETIGAEIAQHDSNGSDFNVSRMQIRFLPTAPREFHLQTARIDYNFAPYADAIRNTSQGIPIAGWDKNHLAVVGWQNCFGAKTLFVSLSLDVLSSNDQNTIITDSLQWLLRSPNKACAITDANVALDDQRIKNLDQTQKTDQNTEE